MSVPFIDLKRFEDGFLDAWISKVTELSRETRFIGGDEVNQFEQNLAQDTGCRFALGCANGTDALQLALRGAGIGPGDVVLLPDFTFWATFEAIVNVGAQPVTVDISTTDLQMDFRLFQQAAEKHRPKAAMLVHLYGWGSADLQRMRTYCRENDILLIEDGAQAYGVTLDGVSIYKDADISTISFYPAKVFGAAGDAGAVVTSSEEYDRRIRSLLNHGRSDHYSYEHVGWNSRLDSLQAAYMNLVRPHIEKRLESRRTIAQAYRNDFAGLESVRCVAPPEGYVENGYLNVILLESGEARSALQDLLKAKGIGAGIVYPEPISIQQGARSYIKDSIGGSVALDVGRRVLSLPLFAYMTLAEQQTVMQAVREVCR